MSETPEQEAARIRTEVVQEMKAEESGEAPVVDVASAESKEPEKKTDPWEGVNPALKQAFDNMSTQVSVLQSAETRLKQAESRIGAISNELHTAKQAAEQMKDAPSAAQMAAAAESDEQWESLKKDFPEWADAFDGRFDKKLNVKIDELRAELKANVVGATTPGEIETLKTTFEKRLLSFTKPKWRETIASAEWKEWLAIQPQEIVTLTQSEQAEDAVAVLTAFEKAAQGKKTATEIAAERRQRIKTGDLPVGGKSVPVKSEADMNASELRANIGKEVYAET